MALERINYNEIVCNPMSLIAKDWMLISAGNKERGYNTMCASWGQMGSLWGDEGGAPTTTIFVRPSRYTKEFIDKEQIYTLSFFSNEYKDDLMYLGTHTGRDEDKIAQTSLTPVFDEHTTWFKEASLVLICHKLYHQPLVEEGFTVPEILDEYYAQGDLHEMYIGEIIGVYMNMEE